MDEQCRPADLSWGQQQPSGCGSGKHQAQPGSGLQRDQAGPSGPANRPTILARADPEQQPGQHDRGGLAPPDGRERRRIADHGGPPDKP
jgi:hypothetical protein